MRTKKWLINSTTLTNAFLKKIHGCTEPQIPTSPVQLRESQSLHSCTRDPTLQPITCEILGSGTVPPNKSRSHSAQEANPVKFQAQERCARMWARNSGTAEEGHENNPSSYRICGLASR